MKYLALFLLLATPLHAQIFTVGAGTGTIDNASGASVIMHGGLPLSDSVGALAIGSYNGHFIIGASESFDWHDWKIGAGDKQLTLLASGEGVSASFIGVSAERVDKLHKRKIAAFIGTIGKEYTAGFGGFGTQPHNFGGGYSFQQNWNAFQFNSLAAIAGNQKTLIESGEYHWKTALALTGAAGILQNSAVLNGTANLNTRGWNVNLSHQTLLLTGMPTTITDAALSYTYRAVTGHASVVTGQAGDIHTQGETMGGSLQLFDGKLMLRSDYFTSTTAKAMLVNSATETVRKFSLIQTVARGNGQTTFNVGGGYHSNHFSADVSHNTLFYPLMTNNPWQQTLVVTVSIHLHNASATVGTIALPNGGLKMGVAVGDYLYREGTSGAPQEASTGKFEISGHIVDTHGEGVEGAAVKVGNGLLYSDSTGEFYTHVRKQQVYPLTVVLEGFQASGEWKVVDAPKTIEPGKPITIVVARI